MTLGLFVVFYLAIIAAVDIFVYDWAKHRYPTPADAVVIVNLCLIIVNLCVFAAIQFGVLPPGREWFR